MLSNFIIVCFFNNFSQCHGLCHGCLMAVPGTLEAVNIMKSTHSQYIQSSINGIGCNCIIVCNVQTEIQRLDLRRDGMGTSRETKRFTKMNMGDAYIWRICYINNSYSDLHRIEIVRKRRNDDGSVGPLLSPMIMAYSFKDEPPNRIDILPHGNDKNALPFHPSTRSLMNDLRDTVNPSRIYNQVK